MPKNDRDPVHAVKAFLQGGDPAALRSAMIDLVAPDLRVIQDRLDRARGIDPGVSFSESIDALLSGRYSPPASGGADRDRSSGYQSLAGNAPNSQPSVQAPGRGTGTGGRKTVHQVNRRVGRSEGK